MLGLGNSISSAALIGGGIESISDMELWLKNGVGVAVDQWDDSSGNNNHATQATEGNQAAVSGGGLNFEELDPDYYDLASPITIAENGGFTMSWVMHTESPSNNTILSDGGNEVIQIQNSNKFRFIGNDPSNMTTILYKGSEFGNSKMLLTLVRDGDGDLALYKDGVVIEPHVGNSSNLTNDRGFDLDMLGSKNQLSTHYMDGIIYEVLFFSKELDSGELSTLHTELLEKHGL